MRIISDQILLTGTLSLFFLTIRRPLNRREYPAIISSRRVSRRSAHESFTVQVMDTIIMPTRYDTILV